MCWETLIGLPNVRLLLAAHHIPLPLGSWVEHNSLYRIYSYHCCMENCVWIVYAAFNPWNCTIFFVYNIYYCVYTESGKSNCQKAAIGKPQGRGLYEVVSLPAVDPDLINTYVLIVFIFSFDIYDTARITQLVKSAGCLNEGLDGHSQDWNA